LTKSHHNRFATAATANPIATVHGTIVMLSLLPFAVTAVVVGPAAANATVVFSASAVAVIAVVAVAAATATVVYCYIFVTPSLDFDHAGRRRCHP